MPLFGRNKNNDKNDREKPGKPQDAPRAETPAPDPAPSAGPSPAPDAPAPDVPVPDASVSDTPLPLPDAGQPAAQNDGAAKEHIPAAQPPFAPNAEKPRYQTPEGFDFNRYFLAERRIMLENVSYEVHRPAVAQGQFRLNAKDTIVAQLIGQAGVKATYNRMLDFDPEGPFTLSVSFSVMLVFNPGTRGEIDWKSIDIAHEFKQNCPTLVQTMMTKAALLIAEITNANGTPILPIGIR